MNSYDAEIIDPLGNKTKIKWEGGRYSDDSIWWATAETNAAKYLLGYKETITDPYGSVTVREWSTTRNGYDASRNLISFHEALKDAAGNVIYTTDRVSSTYTGDNLTGYSQSSRDGYGNISIANWEGTYNNNNRLTEPNHRSLDAFSILQ